MISGGPIEENKCPLPAYWTLSRNRARGSVDSSLTESRHLRLQRRRVWSAFLYHRAPRVNHRLWTANGGFHLSNGMLENGRTTQWDYPERSGFGRPTEREWGVTSGDA